MPSEIHQVFSEISPENLEIRQRRLSENSPGLSFSIPNGVCLFFRNHLDGISQEIFEDVFRSFFVDFISNSRSSPHEGSQKDILVYSNAGLELFQKKCFKKSQKPIRKS